MLETGKYATIKEIAKAEKINPCSVSRVLRLTLLAPATVEAILEGRANAGTTLAEAMGVFPVEWSSQRAAGIRSTPLPQAFVARHRSTCKKLPEKSMLVDGGATDSWESVSVFRARAKGA